MVLQQGQDLPVWGNADPGESVTVSIEGRTATITADAEGKWRVKLAPFPVSKTGSQLKVSGKNELVFNDVLVGDVWLCSGQSNMAFFMYEAADTETAIAQAQNPEIRFFVVGKRIAFAPETEQPGKWVVCTPETARKFSAVGYFFGREIFETQKIPVGLVGSYWGGTPAEAWTSLEALKANPALAHYATTFEETRANREALRRRYDEETLPRWKEAVEAWRREHEEPHKQKLAAWEAEAATAKSLGQPIPPKPVLKVMVPRQPRSVDGNPRHPSVLFNGMINAIVPYAIRGVIWYQGEGNATDAQTSALYATLFPAMVADWRVRWGQGDFPFFYVQLAGFGRGTFFPELRESQRKSLVIPNSAMAVAIDVGEKGDIHPKNKHDVGHRLALAARHKVYGEKLVPAGPLYRSMNVEGSKIRLRFDHVGSGLAVSESSSSKALKGFEVSGGDGVFMEASARIDGDTVVVESGSIPRPTAVRYGWRPFPDVNLINREGLPAAPFLAD